MPTQMQTPMPGFSATDAIFNFPDSVVARLRPFGKGNQACPVGVPNLTPGWECPVVTWLLSTGQRRQPQQEGRRQPQQQQERISDSSSSSRRRQPQQECRRQPEGKRQPQQGTDTSKGPKQQQEQAPGP